MVNSRMSLDDLSSVTTVLDHLDIGVTIFDANGKFLFVNRGSLHMSGQSRSFYENQTILIFIKRAFLTTPYAQRSYAPRNPWPGCSAPLQRTAG